MNGHMRFDLGSKTVGEGAPAFLIAELSANHNGSLEIARQTIRAAAKAGADAIKLQTYTADTLTIDCDNDYFKIQTGSLWDGTTYYKLYQQAFTPWEWHEELFRCAEEQGLLCFSSPFDSTAVDLLESLNAPAYKIASFEIGDLALIRYAAKTQKPIILSTGIAELQDIEEALEVIEETGNDQIALLKCTSSYPAPIEEANLKTLPMLAEKYPVIVGLSDHTMGMSAVLVSVCMGAKIIEKHFILDRAMGGPDSAFSMEPEEFGQMVRGVREAEKALGDSDWKLTPKAQKGRAFARSLFVVQDVKKGESFTPENVRSIRPGDGLPPKYLDEVLGAKARMDIARGTPLNKNHYSN